MNDRDQACGAIFDMDGTLLDSYHAHQRAWQDTMREFGIDYTSSEFRRHFGRRNEEIIEDIFECLGRPKPDPHVMQEIADRKEVQFRSVVVDDCSEMPGTTGLLTALHREGWKLAVGSSAPRANVELALELLGVKQLVDATVCGCDVERGKPEPDVFLEAARRLGLEPRHCLVVEDAPAGIEAAHRAGMPAVGIRCPHQTADLSAAEQVVDSFDECPESELRKLIKEHES
ncbi:MAG: HAD family phosphatase [Planctomycetota bacterium]|nr:HAD family phosphatase [Planctomycetota bacterium]